MRGKDVGRGWSEKVKTVVRRPTKYCTDKERPTDQLLHERLASYVTEKDGEDLAGVIHELSEYELGGAEKAFDELDYDLQTCEVIRPTRGTTWRLTRVGPGQGKIVLRRPNVPELYGAFRAAHAGDYLSVVIVYSYSARDVGPLALRSEAVVAKKFANEGIR